MLKYGHECDRVASQVLTYNVALLSKGVVTSYSTVWVLYCIGPGPIQYSTHTVTNLLYTFTTELSLDGVSMETGVICCLDLITAS